MKFGGREVKPNIVLVPIPRDNDDDFIFQLKAVPDLEKFIELCPEPKPPKKTFPGGRTAVDREDPEFTKKLEEHAEYRFHYMAIESLKATEALEWDTVDHLNPETWSNWIDEMKEAGFTEVEVNRVVNGVMDVNCLNEERVEEARARFLAGQQADPESE